jgi:enterochelin esterase family protein
MFIFMGSYAQEIGNFMGMQRASSPIIGETEVTFNVSAPYAYTVKLSGSWMAGMGGAVDMVKGANGVWTVSVPTPASELYTYSFIIDGVSINDPSNVIMQRDGTRYLSVLLVPGKVTENYYEANQRGNLEEVWYNSPTLGIERRLFVYTPYGYADNTKTKYPVLYLLHGAGGDEDAWSTMGRACQILDNLIEKGLAKPMLCVMPNGNPTQIAARTLMIPEKQADPNNAGMGMMGNTYPKSIVEDIVPFIESKYRVDPKPKSRAIAGLSMGGMHTITTSLMYPGFFQYICPLSMGLMGQSEDDTLNDQFKALKKAGYKLYFLACGDTDFLYESAKSLDQVLTDNGLKHTFYVTPGGHTWSNWRIYLNTFAPQLFK